MPEVRLIDANDLKMRIQSGVDLIFDRATESEFIYMIDSQPAIEAEPVRHGRWIDGISRGSYSIYCSYCGSYKETICPSEYCPACGAKMDAHIEDDDGSGVGQTFSPD